MRNPVLNSSKHQYVALIHSHLTGHCSIKELRDFIGFNRTQFFQQPVYNIQPFKLLPQLPRLRNVLIFLSTFMIQTLRVYKMAIL